MRSVQPFDVRQQNYSAILRTVMRHGPIARSELSGRTGMATGTMTKLTSLLSEAGLLRELPAESGHGALGRPRTPMVVDERTHRVVGVHFGLRRTTVCLLDLRGTLLAEVRLPHRGRRGFELLVAQAVEGIQELIGRNPGSVLGVGASTGGWVDREAGVVRDHRVLRWRNVPLREVLADGLGLPTEVDSSFRSLTMAERWFGGAQGVDDLIGLFVGNVVGAGFVLGGRVFPGYSAAAGTVDHLSVGVAAEEPCSCGRRDCLHGAASDLAVLAHARRSDLIGPRGTLEHLVQLARDGDVAADGLLVARAELVGVAAGTLIDMLDPEVVVVSGGVVDAPEYLKSVQRGARAYLRDKRRVDVDSVVRLSAFGTDGVAVSAASVVLDRIYAAPAEFVPGLLELRYG
ncbi:putative NBD/HSP70 family sugar kinase [Kribbella amoyensis]|uniref:Putative NBD/HSP70 family sugar kinase n=1 Tax=Kribbella amoyensis TaxID=996641 RepID=A0A561BUK5_9ACTN|nr:ROK family protein [Kribbella amoyensis]TWD82549.1 putative NBD/HSP70 family sugar kinase [Kribbella amoyensis]